jgi:hypothetical protein
MMLAGAAVYYRTRLQPAIAQSSTEAEFTNMADAGKAALYLRWILEEIGIIMKAPTPILAHNQGAVRLANAHQPTRRTRHVEIHFILYLCNNGCITQSYKLNYYTKRNIPFPQIAALFDRC